MLFLNQLSAPAVKILSSLVAMAVLSACGGSSGGNSSTGTPNASNENEPVTTASNGINYSGPAARGTEVQLYRSEIWSNLAQEDRCGECHVVGGAGTTAFADRDDINLAYDQAVNSGVLGTSLENSQLMNRIRQNHGGCWNGDSQEERNLCVSQAESWIGAFFNPAGEQSFLESLNLTAPVNTPDLGQVRVFPDLAPASFNALHTITTTYCSQCHSSTATDTQQSPYFGDADIEVSYNAVKSGLVSILDFDLGLNPADSFFADGDLRIQSALTKQVKARHQGVCWFSGDCVASARETHNAIFNFINGLELASLSSGNQDLVLSKVVNFAEHAVASAGAGRRAEPNVIAKWEFGEESGSVVLDSSGVNPLLPLTMYGDVERMSSGGVRFNGGKLQGRVDDSAKLYDLINASGEYTIEAWVIPLNITQDNSRIVTYAVDDINRNFALTQNLYDYDFYARSSTTDASGGMPVDIIPDEAAQATLQYVVATYSATEGRKVYVNGELVSEEPDPAGAGNFGSWGRDFVLAVGSTVTNEEQFEGSLRFLAIHDREMPVEDILTNFEIGVGQKYYLLFPISAETRPSIPPLSYIVMQIELFDDYSYLFNEPFFATLDPDASTNGYDFNLQGMRIGVNGQLAPAGQSYIKLPEYSAETMVGQPINNISVDAGGGRQILSSVGTVIPLQRGTGIGGDSFFLSFDTLGDEENVIIEGVFDAPPPVPDNVTVQSGIGIKTFDEINEALSALTGISITNPSVANSFATLRQQLPVEPSQETFAASQQMAVTQLAVLYCKELVDTNSEFFSGFDFNASPTAAFDAQGKSQIISPLLTSLLANSNTVESVDQVEYAVAEAELDGLIDTLLGACSDDSCVPEGSTRVDNIVTATCAAAFANGMMLIQ